MLQEICHIQRSGNIQINNTDIPDASQIQVMMRVPCLIMRCQHQDTVTMETVEGIVTMETVVNEIVTLETVVKLIHTLIDQ